MIIIRSILSLLLKTFAHGNFLLKNLEQGFLLENIYTCTYNYMDEFYHMDILLSISMYSVIYIGAVPSVNIRELVKVVMAATFF